MPDYSFYSSFRRSRNSLGTDEHTPLSLGREDTSGRSFDEEDDIESTYHAPTQSQPPIPPSGSCFSCQMLLLFVIGALVAFQQIRLFDLSNQLSEQQVIVQNQQRTLTSQSYQLHYLNSTIGGESGLIESFEHSAEKRMHLLEVAMSRFNNTVSNSEVVARLDEVEIDLDNMKIYLNKSLAYMLNTVSSTMKAASADIHRELDLTETDILQRLGQTNNDLNDAVKNAKEEIQEEVTSVRTSMDQYVQITNSQFRAENDFLKYQLAGTFTLLGTMIAIWHVTQHVRHMNRPSVQRRIIAILNMVPVYGITSWLSLVFPVVRTQLGVLRDCYEAYAVYTFFAFLSEVLRQKDNSVGESDADLVLIIEGNARHKLNTGHGILRPPLYCPCGLEQYTLRALSRAALLQCRFCLMQFVLLKPLLTLAPFFCTAVGIPYETHAPLFDNHIPDLTSPMFYVLFLSNVSVTLAFYGLVSFYHLVDDELAWVDPWPKFLCIKGVVFMTFWQGFVINLCGQFGYIDAETAVSAQDFLICIEMFIASIAHFYIFQHGQWADGYKEKRDAQRIDGTHFRASDNFALPDFANDIRRDFGLISRSVPLDVLLEDVKEVYEEEAAIRKEVDEGEAATDEEEVVVRSEVDEEEAAIRKEVDEEEAAIRKEVDEGEAVVRSEVDEAVDEHRKLLEVDGIAQQPTTLQASETSQSMGEVASQGVATKMVVSSADELTETSEDGNRLMANSSTLNESVIKSTMVGEAETDSRAIISPPEDDKESESDSSESGSSESDSDGSESESDSSDDDNEQDKVGENADVSNKQQRTEEGGDSETESSGSGGDAVEFSAVTHESHEDEGFEDASSMHEASEEQEAIQEHQSDVK